METNDHFHIVKKCSACGNMSVGNYCVHCGEKLEHSRVTLFQFLKGFPELIFHTGFHIFYTIYELIIHPGQMVKSYFAGNRKKHYKPVNFFLFIGGLTTMLYITQHISSLDTKVYEGMIEDVKLARELDKINNDYLTGILMLQFPFVAFFTWLFFRRQGYYFGEHLVANAYFIGEVQLLRIILFPVYFFINKAQANDILDLVNGLLIVAYYIYAFYDWFYNKKTWIGLFKIFFFVVIIYIVVMILSLLFIVPGLYLFQKAMAAMF